MKDVKVLGSGCVNCKNTAALIAQVAQDRGVEISLQKIEDPKEIAGYGVMRTPGVVIDGQVVHSGGIPVRDKVEQWF